MKKIKAFRASDYAGLETADLKFYYGYEETVCPTHKTPEDCEADDCGDSEWAFTVDKNGERIMHIGETELEKNCTDGEIDSTEQGLLVGIGMYLRALPL